MGRVTDGHMQFICGDYAELWITIFPPELVADRCNGNRAAGRRCFLNDRNHSRCRHEQCDDNKNGNDSPRQFHLIAAVYLGRFSAVVIPSLSELHDRVNEQGENN